MYQSNLRDEVLMSLRKIKNNVETAESPKVDMWCHLGTSFIRAPGEGSVHFSLSLMNIGPSIKSPSCLNLSHLARLTKWFIYRHIHDVNVIFDIVEDVLQQTWGIEEITEKFQKAEEGESFWKVSFTQRDDIPEDIFKRNGYIEITEDDEYISRYDLTYLTPCFHKLRCKVSYRDLFLFSSYADNERVQCIIELLSSSDIFLH